MKRFNTKALKHEYWALKNFENRLQTLFANTMKKFFNIEDIPELEHLDLVEPEKPDDKKKGKKNENKE